MFLAKLLPQKLLSQQARKPSGFIGRFIMSNIFTIGNNDLNCFVEESLNIQSSDRVLEIGFGPGKLINKMASIITDGYIEGIDFSKTMLVEAIKNNEKYISSNKVRLQKGDCKELDYANNTFDKICSVNTLYFWNPPEMYLLEIFRVLKSGGHFVLGVRSSEQMNMLSLDRNVFNIYSLNKMVKLVSNAGFINVHIQEKDSTLFVSYCIIGTKA